MDASYLLRHLGQALSKAMYAENLPVSLVDGWVSNWALMAADCDDPAGDVVTISTSLLQSMTMAQELIRIYRRG